MKRVTIYSVAHEAGVSLATVSRVINGSNVVREETRKRVQDAIDKLEYKPNAVAQGLALQKTTSIALVVPESSFSYIGKIINGLLNVAKIYKYNIILHTSTVGINEMNEIIENIIKSHVDGVIVYNDHLKQDELNTLRNYNVPIVYIGNRMSGDSICSVFVDMEKAIMDLTGNYLRHGVDDIAVIQDRKNPLVSEQILSGVRKAYENAGKTFNGYVEIPNEYRTTYAYLGNYFKTHRHQLVIANRDSQAIAVLNACQENNISVPDDMEIFCATDSKYNDMARPQLSSFSIPSYDLGALAMRIMTKMLNHDTINDKEIELSYLYTHRQSTK
ncbi:MAG: LacI family DNA-binding transcriptional regulator [Erysipelotrichaceae bacterium]|nr:LacI family DNA-binding transcriptional regulator [Erysipelotrichaceae bacterium]